MGYAIFVDGQLRVVRPTLATSINRAENIFHREQPEVVIVSCVEESYEYIIESEDWLYRIDKTEEE
jgi:hypothetical protein